MATNVNTLLPTMHSVAFRKSCDDEAAKMQVDVKRYALDHRVPHVSTVGISEVLKALGERNGRVPNGRVGICQKSIGRTTAPPTTFEFSSLVLSITTFTGGITIGQLDRAMECYKDGCSKDEDYANPSNSIHMEMAVSVEDSEASIVVELRISPLDHSSGRTETSRMPTTMRRPDFQSEAMALLMKLRQSRTLSNSARNSIKAILDADVSTYTHGFWISGVAELKHECIQILKQFLSQDEGSSVAISVARPVVVTRTRNLEITVIPSDDDKKRFASDVKTFRKPKKSRWTPY